jgi:gas vesicle protein
MLNENQQPVIVYRKSNTLGVLVGMLIGGLTGAVTMLLMAPQSGKETRRQIQEKGIELRNRTTEIVDDVVTQVRLDMNKFNADGRQKANELLQQGQEVVVEQLDHVSEAALAGKRAIQSS